MSPPIEVLGLWSCDSGNSRRLDALLEIALEEVNWKDEEGSEMLETLTSSISTSPKLGVTSIDIQGPPYSQVSSTGIWKLETGNRVRVNSRPCG